MLGAKDRKECGPTEEKTKIEKNPLDIPSYASFLSSLRSSGFNLENTVTNHVRTISASTCEDLEAQLALHDSSDALLVIEYSGSVKTYETARELASIIESIEGVFKLEFSSQQNPVVTKVIPVLFQPLSFPNVRIIELEISFQYEHFSDAAAAALAELVRRNSTLKALDLKSCRVGDAGALALVTALAAHESLERLNLRSNVVSDQGARNMLIHLALYPIPRAISINVADNSIRVETQRKLRRVFNGKSYPSILYDEDDITPPACPCRCERCLQKPIDTPKKQIKYLPKVDQAQQFSVTSVASPLVASKANQLSDSLTHNPPPQPQQSTGRLPQNFLCVCTCGAQEATPLITDSDDESEKEKEQEKMTALRQQVPTLLELSIKAVCENEKLFPRDVIKSAPISGVFKQKILELRAFKRQKDISRMKERDSSSPSPWPFPTGDFFITNYHDRGDYKERVLAEGRSLEYAILAQPLDTDLLGEVDLSDYNSCKVDEKKKNVFTLFNADDEDVRQYVMSSGSDEETLSWLESFNKLFKSEVYLRYYNERQEKTIKMGQPPPENTNPLLISGWMKKLGGGNGGAKNWKKRWFKNTDDAPFLISYYTTNSPKKSNLKGTVDLTQLQSIAFSNEPDGSLKIIIVTPARTWEFLSETEDREYWKQAFTALKKERKILTKRSKRPRKRTHRCHHYGPWQECLDPKGHKYYWNTKTNITQWEMPEEVHIMKKKVKARRRREKKLEAEEEQSKKEGGHKSHHTKTGQTESGINPSTSSSSLQQTSAAAQSSRPPCPLPEQGAAGEEEPMLPPDEDPELPGGWKRGFDTTRNHVYYFNKEKGLTQWEFPTE